MRVVKCKTLEIEEWHIEKWRESTGRNRQTNWSESWRYYYTVTNEFNASEFLWNWIALPELFCIFTSRVHFNNAALAAVFADSSFTFCSSFHNSNFISISFHYRYAEINFRSSNSQTGKREHLLYRYTRTSIHFSIPFFVSLFAFYVNFIHFSIMFFVLENDFTTQFTLGVSFFLRSHSPYELHNCLKHFLQIIIK